MPSFQLPAATHPFLPHRPPMVYVDRLLEAKEKHGLCEARLTSGHMLLDNRGHMDRAGFIELTAQAFAALKGYELARQGLPFPMIGYLVGSQGFECLEDAEQGDLLTIETELLGTFEDFGVVRGTVRRDETILARGKIKLYVPDSGNSFPEETP